MKRVAGMGPDKQQSEEALVEFEANPERSERRQFLKKIGKAGAMAPMTSLLLAAGLSTVSTDASAGSCGSGSS